MNCWHAFCAQLKLNLCHTDWHGMLCTGYFGGQKSSYDTSFYFITASVNSSLDFVIKL